MVYVSDLQQLAALWTERMGNSTQPLPYRDAVSECLFELNGLIDQSLADELSYQDYVAEHAEEYFNSLEPEEYVA